MFKKPFKLGPATLLKKTDQKRFRETIRGKFQNVTEEQLALVVSIKDEVTVRRLTDSYIQIYFAQNEPIFVDTTGKNDLCPTVYTLWKIPTLVPSLSIHPPVFKYILSGADLMLPGVIIPENGIDGFGAFKKDDVRCVILAGTNIPVAVGWMALGSEQLKRQGMRGKAIEICHFWKDCLWAQGSRSDPPALLLMPAADLEAAAAPDEATLAPAASADATPAPAIVREESTPAPAPAPAASSSSASAEPAATSAQAAADAAARLTAETDTLLRRYFLEAVKTRVKDRDLPMLLSAFYAQHMMACKPEGQQLDIKKSSWKKMSKFVEALVAEGLCEVIEPSEGVLQLSKVNRAHPAFRGLVIERASDDDDDEGESEVRPLIVELYKPTVALAPLFPAGSPEFHERKSLAKFLWAYTAAHQLTGPTGAQVQLDKLLAESLYAKNAHRDGDVVEKKELLERFIAKMQKFHQVNRGTMSEVRKGEVGGVHVIVEQRQGRKHVTRVSGLEGFALSLDELCSELQKMCAASVSQQPLPTGKNNTIEVCIQGNFGEELCNHLRTKYSIPNKYIELEDKSAAKKKK